MTITKAIEYLEWKFTKSGVKPSKKDIEAYNSIIDYKELQETKTLQENELLAKLWIHQLILLNETQMYSAERSIQVIDEILSKSVYDWAKKMHEQANIMRFKTLLDTKEYKDALINLEYDKIKEIGSKLIDEKKHEFDKALKNEIKEENIIKFIKQQITRIINKFEK